jgi:hypothetical protein
MCNCHILGQYALLFETVLQLQGTLTMFQWYFVRLMENPNRWGMESFIFRIYQHIMKLNATTVAYPIAQGCVWFDPDGHSIYENLHRLKWEEYKSRAGHGG